MSIQALGYVGLHATQLQDWSGFATGILGLQLAEQSRSELAFRMDDRRQRLIVSEDSADGAAYFGWEVPDAAAMATVAAAVEAAGTAVTQGNAALADRRRVAGLVHFVDPAGNRVEIVHGAETTAAPFRPGRCISGFRTGALGMGHAVVTAVRIDDVLPFYRDVLGFRLSDWIARPFRAAFMHVNPRHHSFAIIETGKAGLHHLMLELFHLDDVGQGYDIALGEEGRIATTLGRHPNDFVTSFYANTPGGLMIEYGWGGRTIDTANWQAEEVTQGPSLWGHERRRLSPEQAAASRAMRLQAAQDGERRPVQVLPGNHNVAAGECAWWEKAVREAAE